MDIRGYTGFELVRAAATALAATCCVPKKKENKQMR